MSVLDRIAGVFGYSKAIQTPAPVEHRADNGGGYKGGLMGTRGLSDWNPMATSANVATLRNRTRTVARSRDLVRNAPIARGAVMKRTGKVVGTGLAYHSRIDAEALGMTEDQAESWQTTAEREFEYVSTECDITREADFFELQYLAFLSTMENGDVLATFSHVKYPGNVYGTKIQLIEGDRISNPDGQMDSPVIAGGVEFNKYGAVEAYHVLNQHPGDSFSIPRKWERIPAFAPTTGRRVARLLYFRERVGQARGMPMVAPLLEPLKKLDRFSDSTLMNAIVSSMFTVFLETPGDGLGGLPDLGDNQDTDAPVTEREIKMGTGAVVEMPPGYKPHFGNPSNPNGNFDPFFLAFVRQMGMAIETPYEVLLGHYSSSYSASRAALLDAWTTWKRMRGWLVSWFCQPFLEAWMDEAVSTGRVSAPGYFDDPAMRRAYLGAEWIGDAPGALDPLKETNASILKVQNNLSTHSAEIASTSGGSWNSTLRQRSREQKELLAAGLVPTLAQPGNPNSSPAPTSNDGEDGNGDNKDNGT